MCQITSPHPCSWLPVAAHPRLTISILQSEDLCELATAGCASSQQRPMRTQAAPTHAHARYATHALTAPVTPQYRIPARHFQRAGADCMTVRKSSKSRQHMSPVAAGGPAAPTADAVEEGAECWSNNFTGRVLTPIADKVDHISHSCFSPMQGVLLCA